MAEMKMQLNMKKLEGEVELMKVHNKQFEARLQGLKDEIEKEKRMPMMLKSLKQNVFDRLRKVCEHIGPRGLHISYHAEQTEQPANATTPAKPPSKMSITS